MNAVATAPGTEIKCVAHNGAHTGKVVATMGNSLGIRWSGSVAVPKTADERAFMKSLSRAHSLVSVNPSDVVAR